LLLLGLDLAGLRGLITRQFLSRLIRSALLRRDAGLAWGLWG
jgi:hypothetical protein